MYCNGELVKDLVIPNGVTSIGNYTFYRCTGLTSVTIPNNVTTIGDGTFYGCDSLSSLTLGERLDSIGAGAFKECEKLNTIYCRNAIPSVIAATTFDNTQYMNAKLFVPTGTYNEYISATGWLNFYNIYEYKYTSGIDGITTDNFDADIKVENGNIVIENAKGNISVYTTSGAMIQNVSANGESVRINLPAKGMYIIKTNKGAKTVAL